MVGFLHSPTSEEAKEDKKGLQYISDIRKQQINPSEFTFSESEVSSVAFVDSLHNFDCIGDWIEEGLESFTYMSSDNLEENPSNASLGNAENAVFENSINLGCDGLSERSQLEESFVEEVGKTVAFVVTTQEKGVEDCVDFSREKDFDRVGMIGDEAGNLDDFGYLIEEEMGKVTLDSVSSCLVPNTEDEGRRRGIGSVGVELIENGTKCDGDGGSVIEIAIGSTDHPPSESEEENSSRTSSSSDDDGEVETEEGEIIASDIDETVAWSGDEDDVSVGPLKSKNELTVLPPVSPVNVTLEPHHQTLPVGVVLSIVGAQIIVEGVEKHNPLDEGSILWITQTRSPLGMVDEIFGPVKNPYYITRHNSENDVPSGLKPGDSVCFVQEFANHILNDKNLYLKAYDASGANDEEMSEEEEFSDDEKEAEYKKMVKMKKREGNNHENVEKKKREPKIKSWNWKREGYNHENVEKKKMEPKIKSVNWKRDHGSSIHHAGQGNHQQHVPPVVVPPKLDLGNNDQCSSSIGHDLNVRPGFTPPFSQLGQNPGFTIQSAGPNGVSGFPTNNVLPWLGQVNPQLFYQMNMQFGQQMGMNPASLPQNPVFPTVQTGFGAGPGFTTPWPGGFGQNMCDPSSLFGMVAAQGQQLHFPSYNGGHQAFPFDVQQMGYNSSINTAMTGASQPEMSAISSQGPYQNLSNPSQQMACSSSIQPDFNTAGTSHGLNQGSCQNLFNPTSQFRMAAPPGQQQHSLSGGIQQMGFNSGMKPNTAQFGRPDMAPSPNQGRGGGRNPHHRGRGGGRFGGGSGRQ